MQLGEEGPGLEYLYCPVLGLYSKFWLWGGCRYGFCVQMQKLPPYLTDPTLSGSKMDLLMAKTGLIRDDGMLPL